MKKIKVGLVEIGDSFGRQYYLPYSLGILRAYAEKKLPSESCSYLPIIYKRGSIEKQVENLTGADIVFYSAYLWNRAASLELAKRMKENNPEIINVFGGPEVPENEAGLTRFLEKHTFVDIASFGEGEVPFVRVLERCRTREWVTVPAIGTGPATGPLQ